MLELGPPPAIVQTLGLRQHSLFCLSVSPLGHWWLIFVSGAPPDTVPEETRNAIECHKIDLNCVPAVPLVSTIIQLSQFERMSTFPVQALSFAKSLPKLEIPYLAAQCASRVQKPSLLHCSALGEPKQEVSFLGILKIYREAVSQGYVRGKYSLLQGYQQSSVARAVQAIASLLVPVCFYATSHTLS